MKNIKRSLINLPCKLPLGHISRWWDVLREPGTSENKTVALLAWTPFCHCFPSEKLPSLALFNLCLTLATSRKQQHSPPNQLPDSVLPQPHTTPKSTWRAIFSPPRVSPSHRCVSPLFTLSLAPGLPHMAVLNICSQNKWTNE